MDKSEQFKKYREKHKEFHYNNYTIREDEKDIYIEYEFEIPELTKFNPKLRIKKKELPFKELESEYVKNMVFHMGMVELISCWKVTCSPKVIIKCGYINEEQKKWWKKLYFNGLGELFYTNNIKTDIEEFMTIECTGLEKENKIEYKEIQEEFSGYIVPIGGGKDSVVTLETINMNKQKDYCLIVNPKPVTLKCAEIAGIKDNNIIEVYREIDKNIIIMVDNCYGEFVEEKEPTQVGADIFVSSLMKNLGAGIATSGGYVVGRKDLIHQVSERLTAPCVGKDLGANFNQMLSYYKGIFMAPTVVKSVLKTMTFASKMLEKFGFDGVSPKYNEKRADIIQTIELKTEEKLVKFCQGVQKGSPIESYVIPVPDDMPGYQHKEIMAGGSFTPGATIELSCDGPICAPYTAYMQGGLTYDYGKIGIMMAIENMLNDEEK